MWQENDDEVPLWVTAGLFVACVAAAIAILIYIAPGG